ncbi:BTAD domain-containing putative transcriptional regulator [Streptomyces sp. NPDC057456]|uniref:AfsR/SARP family transcriptional regulator n=1 Tax=Streptomyces sp. NPDC057456 TaxID=3346139 RepID=UPI00369A7774
MGEQMMGQDPTAPSFSVLGPMRAWRDGTELDLGPPQQRATLAVLLVRVKRPVPVGEIADVLWGQGQPVSATNVIHRHIGMLRRVLEPELPNRTEGQRLVRVSGGYRLRVGADDVDLTRFRRLRERALEAALAGDAAEAVERFNDALALWRGPVAAGVPAVARAHRLFTALDDEYVAAVREAADTALRDGLADRVLPAIERCAARHPLDEGVHAKLALALAVTGHQAEALDVCRRARTRLAEELGVTPGTELRAAHERVLGGDLNRPPVGVRPKHPQRAQHPQRAEPPEYPQHPDHLVSSKRPKFPERPAYPESPKYPEHPRHSEHARHSERPEHPDRPQRRRTGPPPHGGHGGPTPTTPPSAPAPDRTGEPWIVPGPAAGPSAAPSKHGTPPCSEGTGGQDEGRRPLTFGGDAPAPPHVFVGRLTETARLLAEATAEAARPGDETVKLAAVCGPAGSGKSALAAETARRLADRFPDGLIRIALRGYDPSAAPVAPGEAIRGLLAALDVPPDRLPADPDDVDAHTALWRSVLSRRRFLLLLDDARDTAQIRPLLPATPGCMVLVTSRDQLSGLVAAEGAHRVVLGPLTPEESRELLATRLGPGRLAADPERTERLVEHCAGLPFALHLAAGRFMETPGEPVASPVPSGTPGESDRTTVRRSLYGSYRTLDPDAARLFRLLALHPEPETGVAEAAALAGTGPRRARVLLSALTGVHLLDERAPGRFALRPLERSYAHELVHTADGPSTRAAAVRRLFGHLVRHALPDDGPWAPWPHGDGSTEAPAPLPGTGRLLPVEPETFSL